MLVARAAFACFLDPHAARLHEGVFDRPVRPPAALRSWAAVSEPISAVRFGANIFMRDCTYSVRVFLALSSAMTISQARTTRPSSSSDISRPFDVVASTVTIIRDGPSRTDFRVIFSGLSVEFCKDLILSESMGPLPRIATTFAYSSGFEIRVSSSGKRTE